MFFRRLYIRYFGKKRLPGLLDHYEPLGKSLLILEAALKEYLKGTSQVAFAALAAEIDTLEGQADKIKRRIRNHLPPSTFMEVDKTLFFNYTRSQDNILDSAQDALSWLGMRKIDLPGDLLPAVRGYFRDVARTVELLKPALTATMDLVYGNGADRGATKRTYHDIRVQHLKVSRTKRQLVRQALESGADFSEVYQYVKFVENLHDMSHNAESCADVLRAMIVR